MSPRIEESKETMIFPLWLILDVVLVKTRQGFEPKILIYVTFLYFLWGNFYLLRINLVYYIC